MSEITPEQLAAALTGGFVANDVLNGWVDVSAEGNVARIRFTPNGHGPGQNSIQSFQAVVVPGEETPIVLERPAEPGLSWDDEGGDLIAAIANGIRMWPPDSAWFDMTPAEARELAAHLAAMADEHEAAQAEQNGDAL